LEIDTPLGPARLHVHDPDAGPSGPLGTLALGHGAGGGIGAVDLVAVAAAVVQAGWRVVLVEQPWRVAGRRVAPAPARLDAGWVPAMTAVRALPSAAGPLVVGGRSAGARVACRTALATGAAGVVCLAFPLHPPGRPERSRMGELAGAGVPVLVVQGHRDPFGSAEEVLVQVPAGVDVVAVPGDHGLAAGAQEAAHAVQGWLAALPA
jgi:predicted alpha/beta-hydrolase family hydrolase